MDAAFLLPAGEGFEPADSPGWKVVGAAVEGVSHRREGLPCQDAQGWRALPGGALLIAVADGAGSAAQAERGAARAVASALAAGEAALRVGMPDDEAAWLRVVRHLFTAAHAALLALSSAEGAPVREFAATLTCLFIAPGWLATGQIGDGAAIARREDGSLLAVSRVQRGEYANETYFLSQADALQQLQAEALEVQVDAVAVMSDGLTRLAMKLPAFEPHAPFFSPLFNFAAGLEPGGLGQAAGELAAFLRSERVCARTDDDKALVLAVRANG